MAKLDQNLAQLALVGADVLRHPRHEISDEGQL
jgi:hypothetical protein